MGWLADLLTGGADKLVTSVGTVVDDLVTSDEERLTLKNALQEKLYQFRLEQMNAIASYDQQITERWKSDNEHSITRLVRPLLVVFVFVLFGVVVLADGNVGGFKVNPAYIPVIQNLLNVMVIAYFGSRGIEKSLKITKGR